MSGPIEAEWLRFATVLPPDAGQVQIDETRRAFFAGAFALFNCILRELEPGHEATDADVSLLDAMHEELSRWAALENARATNQ